MRNEIFKGIGIFVGVLVISFLFLAMIVNPMVQDAYTKGYERGKNETCKFNFVMDDNLNNEYPSGRDPALYINITYNFSIK